VCVPLGMLKRLVSLFFAAEINCNWPRWSRPTGRHSNSFSQKFTWVNLQRKEELLAREKDKGPDSICRCFSHFMCWIWGKTRPTNYYIQLGPTLACDQESLKFSIVSPRQNWGRMEIFIYCTCPSFQMFLQRQ